MCKTVLKNVRELFQNFCFFFKENKEEKNIINNNNLFPIKLNNNKNKEKKTIK